MKHRVSSQTGLKPEEDTYTHPLWLGSGPSVSHYTTFMQEIQKLRKDGVGRGDVMNEEFHGSMLGTLIL